MKGKTIGAQVDEMPPMLDLKESDLPQVKDWQVGKRYRVILEVEQTGLNKGYDGNGPVRATFKVLSAKSAGEAKGSSDSEEPKTPARAAKLDSIKNKAKEY